MRGDLNIFLDGEVGHEVVELEDEAEFATTVFAKVFARKRGKFAVTNRDGASVGVFESADKVQEGRLARA